LKHRFRGGAACLVVVNQNIDIQDSPSWLVHWWTSIGPPMLSILISDSLLTSTPDPTGEGRNTPEKETAFKHGIDAQTNMTIWHNRETQNNPITWIASWEGFGCSRVAIRQTLNWNKGYT
jgi:hypothetical protein